MNMEIKETSDYAGRDASELRRDKEEHAALEVLRSTGVNVLEAALVVREVLACGRGRVRRGGNAEEGEDRYVPQGGGSCVGGAG